MNKNDILKSMLKGNDPRVVRGYISGLKLDYMEKMPTPDVVFNNFSFDKQGTMRRLTIKASFNFIVYADSDEEIKEIQILQKEIEEEGVKFHGKPPFVVMRME